MRKSIDAMGSSSCHSPAHCFDESPAGYSWVGCSPAEPTCASPAESIMPNRRSIEKRNDRNAPFHPTPLTKNCKGCPGTNCKGCLGTGHGVGLLGWRSERSRRRSDIKKRIFMHVWDRLSVMQTLRYMPLGFPVPRPLCPPE